MKHIDSECDHWAERDYKHSRVICSKCGKVLKDMNKEREIKK